MQGLVLEGGSMRPIFSCGIMDAMLDNDVHFPYVIGVSAGITDGVSYVSRQKGRNYDIVTTYRNDRRYFGLLNFASDKSIFGLKFLFEDVPQKLVPFDFETYRNSGTKVVVGVTNALTGQAEYLDGMELDDKSTMLKATCAQPLFFPAIEINGVPYYDGGISDSVPAQKALDDGCDKLLVILTRPLGYRKKEFDKKMEAGAKYVGGKYPKLAETLKNRSAMYNAQMDFILELEKQGKALVLRPDADKMIGSMESDTDKLAAFYRHGYDVGMAHMKEIKEMF
ncbi:MAG: patatin family protein [Clostridia bacterium]|nr:patatin family protein [Clostridia bacterium]